MQRKMFLSDKAAWPTVEQIDLDNSQYDAVKLAFESKLALIQGSAGTDKIYIDRWKKKIVVVFFTNLIEWVIRENFRRSIIARLPHGKVVQAFLMAGW